MFFYHILIEQLKGDIWIEQDVDILISSALENQINSETVQKISDRVKIIAESANIKQAEEDEVLKWLCSTYVSESDRIFSGIGHNVPRILIFSLLLEMNDSPLNSLIKELLKLSEERIGEKVELDFVVTIEENSLDKIGLGFLQVRPWLFFQI